MSSAYKMGAVALVMLAGCSGHGSGATVDQAITQPQPDPGPRGCGEDEAICDGVCVRTRVDPANCGYCGHDCPSGACVDGACVDAPCAQGLTACSGDCVNLASDPEHCGGCEATCRAGEVCQDGACVTVCATDKTRCGDACTDLDRDPAHCGDCGTCCATGTACSHGACECLHGLTRCGGACVDTSRDDANCGCCGKACGTHEACVAGVCTPACTVGQTICGDHCADLRSAHDDCGACGTACAADQGCADGHCVGCPTGTALCAAGCCAIGIDGGAPLDGGAPDAGLPIDAGNPLDGGLDAGLDGGADAGLAPNGSGCSSGGQCLSGFCVDATCCATECTGTGLSCNNLTGTCTCGGELCAQGVACTLFHRDADLDGFGDADGTLANGRAVAGCVGSTPPAGFVNDATDCDDGDSNAHPGQTAFFGAPSAGKASFDYDCDGVPEKETAEVVGGTCGFCGVDINAQCTVASSTCATANDRAALQCGPTTNPVCVCCGQALAGFTTTVACGKTGSFTSCGTCSTAGGTPTTSTITGAQRCH